MLFNNLQAAPSGAACLSFFDSIGSILLPEKTFAP